MDPGYEKGKRLRQQIYDEYPFLHPDPEFHSREMKPRPIICQPLPPKPVVPTQTIKVHKLALPDLVNCIVKEYHRGGNGRMKDLLLPCSIEFCEKSEEDPSPPVDMNEVQEVVDSMLDQISEDEKMDETNQSCESTKELTETEEMILHILTENVVPKAVDTSFVRGVILKVADFAVGESFANAMSKKKKSFLSEVPLDMIDKRRSGRHGRGGCYVKRLGLDSNSESMLESPRGDDMTAKALLESLFPSSLLTSPNQTPNQTPVKNGDKNKLNNVSPLKKVSSLSPVKKETMEETWLPDDQDQASAKKCIEECMTNTCLNSCLSDLLLRLTEELKNIYHWPRHFDQSYLNLYQCWRPHFVLPSSEEIHEFVEVMIIANEIVLRDLTAFSIYDSENADTIDKLTEHLWDDLQHLVLLVYQVSKPMAVRILSLHLHYYKFKEEVRIAF